MKKKSRAIYALAAKRVFAYAFFALQKQFVNGEVHMVESAQPKKNGCFKRFGIGCLTVIVLLAVGSFFAYRGAKAFVVKATAEYTETAPAQLPAVEMPEAEKAALFQRVDAFAQAVRAGQPAPELSLTAREVNALIQRSPDLAGKVYVYIEDGRIRGDTSIPLEEIAPVGILKGRWLNGSASFTVDTVAGRIVVFIDSLSVRGKPVSAHVMGALRSKNLAEKASEKNPKTAAMLQKLDAVAVRGDRLVIKAK
jgi:hypothetical protein